VPPVADDTPINPPAKFPLWILAALLALGTTACVAPGSIKPGSDPIVVQAEQFRIEAVKTLDSFIQWADRNPGLGSDVRAARDLAATEGPRYLRELREATRQYKALRDPASASTLEERMKAVRLLLELVRQHATPKTP
jgi:hypothetical protein